METRKTTLQILEQIEHGMLDVNHVLLCCLKYMSENDVKDMAHVNDLLLDEGE